MAGIPASQSSQGVFSWVARGEKKVLPLLSYITAQDEFVAACAKSPQSRPLELWREYKKHLAARLFGRCLEEASSPFSQVASGITEWRRAAREKRVVFYCADEAPTLACDKAHKYLKGSAESEQDIKYGGILGHGLASVSIPVSELTPLREWAGELARKSAKRGNREPVFIFFCTLVSIYQRCCVFPEPGTHCRCDTWQEMILHEREVDPSMTTAPDMTEKIRGHKKIRLGAPVPAYLLDRMHRLAPTQEEHIQRMLHPRAPCFLPVHCLLGLGFLRADSHIFKLAPRRAPSYETTETVGWAEGTSLPVIYSGNMYWEEPVLALPTDVLSCPELSEKPSLGVALPEGEIGARRQVQFSKGPYLFHWKDAPGVANPQQDLQLCAQFHLRESLVLFFLRTLCAMDYGESAGGDLSHRALHKAQLDSPWRLHDGQDPIPPEHMSGSMSPCVEWVQDASGFFDMEVDRAAVLIRHAERYCIWFLLYLFSGSSAGMIFYKRALGVFWRERLRYIRDMEDRMECLRVAEMEHLLEGARSWEPSLLETLEDRVVTEAISRLQKVAPVAARCFLSMEVPTSLNILLLRCRNVFLQWRPEVDLVEKPLENLSLTS